MTTNFLKSVATLLLLFTLSGSYALSSEPAMKIGGDFTLRGSENKKVSLQAMRGKVVLLFFGYLSCPDVCPTTFLLLKRMVAGLGEEQKDVKVVFVSIDPDRDKPDATAKYAAYFNPAFVGLSGSQKEVAQVAQLYRTFYKKKEQGSEAGYLVSHTDYIYLVDQKGLTRNVFNSRTPIKEMQAEILGMLGKSR